MVKTTTEWHHINLKPPTKTVFHLLLPKTHWANGGVCPGRNKAINYYDDEYVIVSNQRVRAHTHTKAISEPA